MPSKKASATSRFFCLSLLYAHPFVLVRAKHATCRTIMKIPPAALFLHGRGNLRDESMRVVHLPREQRCRMFVLLRHNQHRMRLGVELGSRACHSLRVGRLCDLLRYSCPSGETPQAQGHIARASVESSAWNAYGETTIQIGDGRKEENIFRTQQRRGTARTGVQEPVFVGIGRRFSFPVTCSFGMAGSPALATNRTTH